MQLRHAGMVALEGIRIHLVAPANGREHIVALTVDRRHRVDPAVHSEQAELRERRRLKLLIGYDIDRRRMIQRDQLDLVDVGDLAQFLRDADFVLPVAGLQPLGGDGDVLVVIHREILPIARTGAQWGYAQHVGDELETLAVPGEDHGARPGESRRLFDNAHAVDGELGFVLDQTVRPSDAYGVYLSTRTQAETYGRASINSLLIEGAGFDLDLGIQRQFGILHSGQPDFDPVTVVGSDVVPPHECAVLRQGHAVQAAVPGEIGHGGRLNGH